MKQQQSNEGTAASSVQKVDSPLAKYTAKGDLVCILCKLPVKSSAGWTAHCNSAIHKQNLETLLKKKQQQQAIASQAAANDEDGVEPTAKRAKFSEDTDDQVHQSEHPTPSTDSTSHSLSVTPAVTQEVSNEAILKELRFVTPSFALFLVESYSNSIFLDLHH